MDVGGRAKVETPDQVAALIRKAIKHIKPERLILSTDCEFGRQGMSRLHAFYKMVSIVQGANLIKRELGFQEAPLPRGGSEIFVSLKKEVYRRNN
jgi:5-methyltetrahydropteroyltriglutamate--homocysteine methyltransferase